MKFVSVDVKDSHPAALLAGRVHQMKTILIEVPFIRSDAKD